MPDEIDIFTPIEDNGWNTDDKCPHCKLYIDETYRYADDDEFLCPHCEKPVVCETWTQYIMRRPE